MLVTFPDCPCIWGLGSLTSRLQGSSEAGPLMHIGLVESVFLGNWNLFLFCLLVSF